MFEEFNVFNVIFVAANYLPWFHDAFSYEKLASYIDCPQFQLFWSKIQDIYYVLVTL